MNYRYSISAVSAQCCVRPVKLLVGCIECMGGPMQWCCQDFLCEEGQILKLCHGALTVDFGAGCSTCSMINSFVNVVLVERAVICCR